jgi:lysophospholipase L1-like esterase
LFLSFFYFFSSRFCFKNLIMIFTFRVHIVALLNCASALTLHRPVNFAPKSYAALGDSYSAGIGAGTFTKGSIDGRDNPCARTNGGYPFVLAKSLGLLGKESNSSLTGSWTDFYACSGDELHSLDAQIKQMKDKKVDLITLSISGNDFLFGDVVVCDRL